MSDSVARELHYTRFVLALQGQHLGTMCRCRESVALMALGGRIRQRRLEKKLSPTELARRAGIARGYLYRIENGEVSRPSAEVLQRIAQALDTSLADLLEHPESLKSEDVPLSLRRLAQRDKLEPEVVAMLASIDYRGRQPRTVEGWAHVLSAIRLATLGPTEDS